MYTTVLKAIMEFLFGRKYYANTICTHGTTKRELCSYIFLTKEEANKHKEVIDSTVSFRFLETISFRSRKDYTSGKS